MRDSTTHQRSRYQSLDALTFVASTSTTFEFAIEGGGALVIEAHAPGLFRLSTGEAGTDRALDLAALLAREEPVGEATLEPMAGGWRIRQGEDVLSVYADPPRFAMHRQDRLLFCIGDEGRAGIGTGVDEPGWMLEIPLHDDDGIFGLGESQLALDRRGEHIVSDDPDAHALPLAWSQRGWGLHVNALGRVQHRIDSEPEEAGYFIEVAERRLDVFFYVGEPGEILSQYSQLTGRAGQPPLWSLGPWLRQAPQSSVEDLAASATQLKQSGFPIETLCMDGPAAWDIKGKQAFEWDASRLPDARAWLAQCKAADLKICAPGFPGVLQASEAFEELEDRGWLLTNDEGLAHVFEGVPATRNQPFGLLDLTHKDVYNFWCERNRQLFDDGIDAIACNAQLDIRDDVQARNGASGARLRELYPMLAARNLFDAAAWNKVPPEGVVWHRDTFPAAQRLPFVAGPTVPNTWEGLAESLRAALTTGASGVPVQSHEIGSQDMPLDAMTPELYVRWLMVGVFSAHFRFQGLPALLPSAFDEATQARVRTWLEWRYRLIPYVLGAIEDAARNGLPVQRSMALSFPDDPEAQAYESQYLLGPALLVAPLLESGDEVTVYFPAGEAWWDLATGWRYEGGTAWTFPCPDGHVPVFGRDGHILCLGTGGRHTGEFNSARLLEEVWLFGMPQVSPTVMRNKIRVMQMQGSSYIKGLEGLKIVPSEGLEVKRRGAEVRISRAR
ncbi:glycoside hydrolase family 31 protein [Verticiella sediminum]|uniref:Glycoside hydrolase family 31 protein n=1 Tax=Verticiella sediminum TaxID=1247510 RepID=A0A556A7K4_9BURK|nr:glycoside hydrolase family 31 protein [Verticiella sediminum]TSH88867.1 glycoside hydrolase family 31 protein [Verticiella sediminum]